ncbi:hypothetical protein MTO96_025474 [Rhipicephalus appendiculatus]
MQDGLRNVAPCDSDAVGLPVGFHFFHRSLCHHEVFAVDILLDRRLAKTSPDWRAYIAINLSVPASRFKPRVLGHPQRILRESPLTGASSKKPPPKPKIPRPAPTPGETRGGFAAGMPSFGPLIRHTPNCHGWGWKPMLSCCSKSSASSSATSRDCLDHFVQLSKHLGRLSCSTVEMLKFRRRNPPTQSPLLVCLMSALGWANTNNTDIETWLSGKRRE